MTQTTEPASGGETTAESKPRKKFKQTGLHPLTGTRLSSWLRVYSRYARRVPMKYWPRAARISLVSLFGTPIRLWESLRLKWQMRNFEAPTPVFVFGHWRSGTTNFHNHMLQDPQYTYISLLQCLLSPSFFTLEKFLRWLLRNRLPATRPMDSVPAGLDEPMSEDFAMACLSEFTHYHRYFFPDSNDEIIDRTIMFENVSDDQIDKWYRQYDHLLRKVSLAAGGKRLVLKNPPNTGRIRQLVKYYPDAPYIHVYRNPYAVFASTQRLMEKFLGLFSFQRFDLGEVEDNVLKDYARVMRRFFDDEHLLPEKNFIQVRHEDVVADGVGTIEEVYKHLRLPGYEEMRPKLEAYVESISDYETNRYEFSDETISKIREHCGFAIDRWGYEPPE